MVGASVVTIADAINELDSAGVLIQWLEKYEEVQAFTRIKI